MMKYPFLSERAFLAPCEDIAVMTASAIGLPLSSATVPAIVPVVSSSGKTGTAMAVITPASRSVKRILCRVISPPLGAGGAGRSMGHMLGTLLFARRNKHCRGKVVCKVRSVPTGSLLPG